MNLAVLYASQRTGSHALGSIINSTHQAVYIGEIFHARPQAHRFVQQYAPDDIHDTKTFKKALTSFARRIDKSHEKLVVMDIKEADSKKLGRLYGFKLRQRTITSWMAEQKLPIIHLQRRNTVRKALSLLRGEMTKEMQRRAVPEGQQEQPARDKTFYIDTELLQQKIRRIERFREGAKQALVGCQVHELWYEDVFAPDGSVTEETISVLQEALNMEDVFDRKPKLQKIAPKRIEDMVKNYSEIERYLAGTPYEEMLNQP